MFQTLLKSVKQAASGLTMPHTSHYVAPGLVLVAAGLGLQLGLAWAPPSPEQMATTYNCFIAHAGWPQAGNSTDNFRPHEIKPSHSHELYFKGKTQ